MRQRLARELLDDDLGTPAEVQRSLDELWWINRHLGGLSTWRRLLERWWLSQAPLPRALRMLDVGAGTGQMAAANAAGLRGRGTAVDVWALDRRAGHLRGANGIAGDAFRLPFADGSVDLVTCNLFLHHFHDQPRQPGDALSASGRPVPGIAARPPSDQRERPRQKVAGHPGDGAASRLLAEMLRVARHAVLINDLDRGWLGYLAIQLLGVRFSRITRHDGPRSVRQAYTARELEALARSTRAARYEVHRLWPCRLGMILWK
ncbi:MAG: methyltransferase domain-containing protein [Streptosporangiaceae bacterium]